MGVSMKKKRYTSCLLSHGRLSLCSCGKRKKLWIVHTPFTERSFPVELTDSTDGYTSLFTSDLCVVDYG